MSWKNELKLDDLDPTQRLEIRCCKCHHAQFIHVCDLVTDRNKFWYVDELENRMECRHRFCKGRVRISLVHIKRISPFIGGMA